MLYYKCSTFIYNSIKVILYYFILKDYSYRVVPRKIRVVGDLVWLPSVGVSWGRVWKGGGPETSPEIFFSLFTRPWGVHNKKNLKRKI